MTVCTGYTRCIFAICFKEKKSKSRFCWVKLTFAKTWSSWKNSTYGILRISQPMRIVRPIQFWRDCVIYLQKKISFKIFETIFLQNLWNNFPPKSLKLIFFKIFETILLQNLWKSFLQNLLSNFPPKSLKQISYKIFETLFLQNQ